MNPADEDAVVAMLVSGIEVAKKHGITQVASTSIEEWMKPGATPKIGVAVSYTHLRAHETVLDLVCRLLLEKKTTHTHTHTTHTQHTTQPYINRTPTQYYLHHSLLHH